MVEAVSATILSQPMFNLSVDTAHTFFVGEGQWLVHNDECVYQVKKHKDQPSVTNHQSHHGVSDKWMEVNYGDSGYSRDEAPTVLMPNVPDHNNTRGVHNTWAAEMRRKYGSSGNTIPWEKISFDDIIELSNRQFQVTNVPPDIQTQYWTEFNKYLQSLGG